MKKTLFACLAVAMLLFIACSTQPSGHRAEDNLARTLLDSALLYIDRQDLQSAMLQLKKAEKLLPALENAKTKYQICQYIGWINETSSANELALHYQGLALDYAREYGKPELVVDVLINQANTLYNMGLNDSAWSITLEAARFYEQADRGQQSVIKRHGAYHEMLEGDLQKAERHAYEAAMLAEDPSAEGNALALLCQIYIKQGRDHDAQMLMGVMPQKGDATLRYNQLLAQSDMLERQGDFRGALMAERQMRQLDDSLNAQARHLDIVKIQNQFDRETLQREKAEQRLWFSLVVSALLLAILALTAWFSHRTRSLYKRFKQRIGETKQLLADQLSDRNATIDQLKHTIDERMNELAQLQQRLPSPYRNEALYSQLAETKQGVDVLYSIVSGENISQMGKQEQRAVTDVLWQMDQQLAEIIDNPENPLTPKETFFCIMEHCGMSDREKADAFCSSEQAVRSTKSRLGKKLDIDALRANKEK